jgi:hypothetical protein
LIPPIRIILHPIGRVGDHKVRIDAAEHALDVSRDRAIAAEETVPALGLALELVPAMLTGARDRHRLIARSIGVVLWHFGHVTFAPRSHRSPVRDTGCSGASGASSGSVSPCAVREQIARSNSPNPVSARSKPPSFS